MKAETLTWLLRALATTALVFPSAVHAQNALQVVKLRSEKVALYDKPNGTKTAEYPRDKFKGPWPVVGSSPEGYLQVEVDGARYWVRQYAIETNKVVRTTAECSTVVAGAQTKSTSVRGIGEE
jgi:hypothetical protein